MYQPMKHKLKVCINFRTSEEVFKAYIPGYKHPCDAPPSAEEQGRAAAQDLLRTVLIKENGRKL